MLKKVLFISPTPTHPPNAGNRVHIKSLVSFFKEHNCDVHFLYLEFENFDVKAMDSFLNNNLEIIVRDKIYQNRKTLSYILWKIGVKRDHLKRRLQLAFGKISKEQYQYNGELDNSLSVFARKEIKRVAKTTKYDIVVCEYSSMSKSLTYFDENVFKILDTHDLFTDRFKIYLNSGVKPSWVSLYKDQESKAVNRANLLLVVRESDRDFLSKLNNVITVLYNYIPEIVMLPRRIFEKKLLYLASGNAINISTINFFLEKIFPLILANDPDTKLIIGGNICEVLNIKNPNIILYGAVNEAKDFYSLGDIVINPEKDGTGYKVKALEALAHGMPLVSTSAGCAGAIEPFRDQLFFADEPPAFAEIIKTLFNQPKLRETLSLNAHNWIKHYKNKIEGELIKHLPL